MLHNKGEESAKPVKLLRKMPSATADNVYYFVLQLIS